jgi:hypothetical protein
MINKERKDRLKNASICPRCDSLTLIDWRSLAEDELYLAERLPISSEMSTEERKKHRICTRCWFVISADEDSSITLA